MSLSCKKSHCKLIRMRNWFWLRSSHPFSLFTPLQPKFSSSLRNVLMSAAFCTLSARYLWLLMLTVGAEGTTPLYSISPGHSPPHQLCALTTTACLTPPSLRLSGHCSTFNSSPSWPSALGRSYHLSQDKGASCSIGIWQKIPLFEKHFMFSTTST